MSAKTFSSLHNGEIELVGKKGSYEIMVNGYVESGNAVENIWTEAFLKLTNPKDKIKNVLVLGFAGGSVVKLIRKKWKDAKITAVEIDPVMIMIAKKYFPSNTKEVDIKIADAVNYVEKLPSEARFDLALIDIYLGGDRQPENAKALEFLLKLKKISSQVIVNQLLQPHATDKMKKVEFLRELSEYHPVKAVRVAFNVMIGY